MSGKTNPLTKEDYIGSRTAEAILTEMANAAKKIADKYGLQVYRATGTYNFSEFSSQIVFQQVDEFGLGYGARRRWRNACEEGVQDIKPEWFGKVFMSHAHKNDTFQIVDFDKSKEASIVVGREKDGKKMFFNFLPAFVAMAITYSETKGAK